MKFDIMTLFPDAVRAMLGTSIIGHAQGNGLVEINCINIRDFAFNRHRRTDDYPYGGGQGLLMLADPLFECHRHLTGGASVHTVLLSAQGVPFSQQKARELLEKGHVILVCGHYEGVDQRFIDECIDEEISLGDFVLTGGEIPAMAVADAVCRMVPGVLSDESCFTDESHFSGLLEYPQYTRPEVWHGRKVPEILLSGHHENIRKWKRAQSIRQTLARRPDLLKAEDLSDEDQKLLSAFPDEDGFGAEP